MKHYIVAGGILILVYIVYIWFNGWYVASQRCDEGKLNKLVAAVDIKSLTNAPLGSIALEGYKAKISQCYDLSSWK